MICPACKTDNIEGADACANCGQALAGLDLPGADLGSKAPDFVNQPLSSLTLKQSARVSQSDPVGLAVRQMQSQGTNCILVMEGERLAGIITNWDVLHKVAGPNEDLNAVTCGEIMTADPLCLHSEDSVSLALNLMAGGGFRHVPILVDEKPSAVIDVSDLFRHLSPHLV
ncbi:MAG: CBS domain-containing protein [Dehalococcoidia bacterium]|nr:CBS domain-containing protein [Dehalococcoidia bacterium]